MPYLNKEKQREAQKEWVARRREEFFAGKRCTICNTTENLELDHIDWFTKEINPTSLWSMSDKNPRKIAELEKCQVMCSVHHLQKTKADRIEMRKHGNTLYGFGCRCSICFEAQQSHNARRNS